ncbi:SHOCT domain-containing protein [soil metagenome]
MTVMWSNGGLGAGMGWSSWVLMGILMLVFWGLVIAGLVALFRTAPTTGGRSRRGAADQSQARMILDERFARGEISVDEYRDRAGELGSWH